VLVTGQWWQWHARLQSSGRL